MLDDATARFFSWAANQRRQPYAKHVVIVSPCGTKHPVMETVTKSRWLEAIDVEKGSIQLDKIHLKGPNVAKTEDDWKAQSFELEKTELQGFRLSAVNEGGNTFRVKAEHVRSFRILLSPQMADLSKTIKVEAGLLGVKFLKPQPLKDDQDYTAQIIFNAGR